MRISFAFISCLFLCVSLGYSQQSVLDSLENVVSQNIRDEAMANALNKISGIYSNRDAEKSKNYAWRAKSLSFAIDSNIELAKSYSILISIYKLSKEQDSVNFYLESLKHLAFKASQTDFNSINQLYYSTAGLYYRTEGNPKEALPYLIKGYEFAQKNGKQEDIYGQAINIGNCYQQLANYNKSIDYYFVALKGFEALGNKFGQAFCYNNIGNSYYSLNRFSESITYFEKSFQLKKELGDKKGLANTEMNLGNSYMGLDNLKKAEKHFRSAIALNEELGNIQGVIANYHNLGRLFSENDPNTALSYFEKSKALAVKSSDSFMISKNDLEILAIKAKDTSQAFSEKNALLSVEAFRQTGQKSDEAQGYKNLADYYSQRQQFDKALEYTTKYHNLSDSIKTNEVLTQFKTIEEQYNQEKNEKQIALLQKDKQIDAQKLKQQRSWITIFGLLALLAIFGIWGIINRSRVRQKMKELELRNNIAADLHDEVGSSLSSIYMLTQLASSNVQDTQHGILDKVKTNAKETMEKMSDIVWMIKPEDNNSESLKDRMRRFVLEICESKGIGCNLQVDNLMETKLTVPQKKNLYLIFKEAVNNAIKYSETKTLDVIISQRPKTLTMIIQDYGYGFEMENTKKGNGIVNMTARAEELKGTLRVQSKKEEGTKIELSFPLD
ncbi:MAG: sensor histidine kinase [Gelidibacter sp.]